MAARNALTDASLSTRPTASTDRSAGPETRDTVQRAATTFAAPHLHSSARCVKADVEHRWAVLPAHDGAHS